MKRNDRGLLLLHRSFGYVLLDPKTRKSSSICRFNYRSHLAPTLGERVCTTGQESIAHETHLTN